MANIFNTLEDFFLHNLYMMKNKEIFNISHISDSRNKLPYRCSVFLNEKFRILRTVKQLKI